MEIKSFGADGMLIKLEQQISLDIAVQVNGLSQHLKKHEAILSTIPAYCSITLSYDNRKTNFEALKTYVESYKFEAAQEAKASKLLSIPVCYDTEFGLDLNSLAETIGLTSKALIELHSQSTYHTYMIGFLPGFPYLGKTVDQLGCKRLKTPRKEVKAGSVGLAGHQTGIYPINAPGGWQIIGRTPLPIFQVKDTQEWLFHAGDKVQFKPIDRNTFKVIEQQIADNTFNWSEIYE